MKILVAGAGVMGRSYIRVLGKLKSIDSILVVEPSQEARDYVSSLNYRNVELFSNLENAIKQTPDCAVVASPTATHFSNASTLFSEGIPVLVEKPITDNLDQAMQLVKMAKGTDTLLMVGHIERFNPVVQALKTNIGMLGKLTYASAHRFGIPAKRAVGNVFLDQAVHDIDVLAYLTGQKPVSVQAISESILDHNFQDQCCAIYEFQTFKCTIEANRVTPIKSRELTVLGLKGSAKLDYISQELTITHTDSAVTKFSTFDEIRTVVGRGTELRPYFQKEEPLDLEVQHFIQCVNGRTFPIVDGRDGVLALAAAEAGINAAKLGCKVQISLDYF